MKKNVPSFRSRRFENLKEGIDYEAYYELAENGLTDRDIADEMNISISFLEDIKKQAKEWY